MSKKITIELTDAQAAVIETLELNPEVLFSIGLRNSVDNRSIKMAKNPDTVIVQAYLDEWREGMLSRVKEVTAPERQTMFEDFMNAPATTSVEEVA